MEIKKLANDKEVVEPCKTCDVLTKEVDSLKCNVSKFQDEALNFSKFKESSIALDDMLSRQKLSQDKEGLGFSKNDKTTSYDGGHAVFGSNLKGKVVGGGNITHDFITITNVEHVSGLAFNLISLKGHRRNDLYTYKLGDNSKQQICLASVVDNAKLWHRRLGHANMRLVQNLASNELVRNLPKLSFERHFCDTCGLGHQGYSQTSKAYIVLNKEAMRIEESLNVSFDESFPEPMSSSSVEDDTIDEPIVQDLNRSPSLQVNVSDEGYPQSLKEARVTNGNPSSVNIKQHCCRRFGNENKLVQLETYQGGSFNLPDHRSRRWRNYPIPAESDS
ncbi:retrotransposon protein [Tanacetum coccineum]|uniref:Retrotransposon protein n=1 Tax=Tanacetum coccineum TaxID=301880 RepID=A0ABQ5DWB7_9ASTR